MAAKQSHFSTFLFFSLRIFIGWHFLYEGISKLLDPNWSSVVYLEVSRWWFADFFHQIATNPTLLNIADMIVITVLILVGVSLMLGLFTRLFCVFGFGLLVFFYLCNPPLYGLGLQEPVEGSYIIINKNVIEMIAFAIVFVYPTKQFGLDILLNKFWKRFSISSLVTVSNEGESDSALSNTKRRDWMKAFAGAPFLGVFTLAVIQKEQWKSYEAKNLVDAYTGASSKKMYIDSVNELQGREMPQAKIKDVSFSRLIIGGNLISGWAHSRDLIYVSQLVKAYHTKDKIFATLMLAEKCGVNTLLTNPIICTLIDEYWKRNIGKIQFISDCAGVTYSNGKQAMPFDEYMDVIKRAIDYGACACYIQGETADFYIENGHIDQLEKAIALIRDNNLPVGIGAHHIETIKGCVDRGLIPDFWMKTLHHHNYWSARHKEWHDNMYCYNPEETIAYMKELKQPWIAFKVMAAGAIHPRDAFQYAFDNGADFICAGMYDFQMVQNVKLALDILEKPIERERPWYA